MRVVIIGGSAHSTPALFEYLAGAMQTGALAVTLMGRDEKRLAAVTRASRLLSGDTPIQIDYATINGARSAQTLEGADVIILQIRVGGYAGRAHDETFPLRYGVCGDEGLGPGGLAAAWRAWPIIEPLIAQVQTAAPDALLLLMSAPLGILTSAVGLTFPRLRAAGICELPWTTLQDACQGCGENPAEARFEYCGVNHMGWLYHISAGGRDLLAEYAAARKHSDDFPSSKFIIEHEGVPMKYLKLHYQRRQVLEQQRRAKRSRAQALDELSRAAFPVYDSQPREEIKAALRRRATPWYTHAVGPFLLALLGQAMPVCFFLTKANDGYCSDFASRDVLEIPHRVENGALKPLARSRPVPRHIAETTRAFVEFERAATLALLNRDVTGVEHALRLHPWTLDIKPTREIVRDITRSLNT